MRWIGCFDVSLFWLAVLVVVVFSMHTSRNVVFEDESVLLESSTNQRAVSGTVPCSGCNRQNEYETGVRRTVLTANGFPENKSCDVRVSGVQKFYGATETGIILIMY